MPTSSPMTRADILRAVIPGSALPLWVPLLTPYRPGSRDVDVARLHRHLQVVRAHTPLWMVGGSTGDGWDMDDRQFAQLLAASTSEEVGELQGRVLFALLAPTTDAVLSRLHALHAALGTSPTASFEDNLERCVERGVVGICVAPPIGEDIDQLTIAHHVEEVGRHARMPVALYEIPQITGNRIADETFQALIASHEEIILFKDSSGEDRLAREASMLDSPVLVRGFESDYASSLRAGGGDYDGLLLSSANVFGQELVAIVRATLSGRIDAAARHGDALETRVAACFDAVADLRTGNAFANANRVVDHVLAHGRRTGEVEPPTLFDGTKVDAAVVDAVASILDRDGLRPDTGYLDV